MKRFFKILVAVIIGSVAGAFVAFNILNHVIYDNIQWKNANYIYFSQPGKDMKTPENPGALYAKYATIMDAESGYVLYEKEGYTPAPMASTTKVMTCILALENLSLDTTCISSKYSATMPDVQMNLVTGEEFTLQDLLYALMLRSYNDSAVVIAENVALAHLRDNPDNNRELYNQLSNTTLDQIPTDTSKELVAYFADMMNQKAVELGCTTANFVTPNGLDGSNEAGPHSISAADLCTIMAYAIKNPDFLKITQASSHAFSSNKNSYSFTNANTFFQMMDGVISGKTGFTNDAGYCYVCALENQGRTYITAVLASGWPGNKTYKWLDTKALMKYGIRNYFPVELHKDTPSPVLLTVTGSRAAYGLPKDYSFTPLLYGNENILYEYIITEDGAFLRDLTLNIYINGKLCQSLLI